MKTFQMNLVAGPFTMLPSTSPLTPSPTQGDVSSMAVYNLLNLDISLMIASPIRNLHIDNISSMTSRLQTMDEELQTILNEKTLRKSPSQRKSLTRPRDDSFFDEYSNSKRLKQGIENELSASFS